EDKKRHEEIQTKNQLDSLVYNTEKTINENKDKVDAEQIKPLEGALASAKKALESGELESMKKELENLNQVSHKLAELMYKASASSAQGSETQAGEQSAGNGGGTQPNAKPDDVIDAEFKDVN
ncbi:MAG: Hsp70 family protein, partial [Bdellovibrionales bacterium]|nr:Hsp70 family protein [Bdellovibrionales bacterium]